MNEATIRKLIQKYRDELASRGAEPEKIDENQYMDGYGGDGTAGVRHLVWCCDFVKSLLDNGHLGYAQQWLGFIQGSLWTYGYKTIEQMRQEQVEVQSG